MKKNGTRSYRKRLFKSAMEAYGIQPDCPFRQDNDTCVLRHPENRKWFALVMHTAYSRFGIDREGEVDVVNLKSSPIMIPTLCQEEGIFPAYHMSKGNWISVLLDGSVPKKDIDALLDISYELTRAKAGGRKTSGFRISSWIVPANPRYFDMEKVMETDEEGTFCFKQSSSVCVGDTIYLYVAAPVSAIRYRCEAVEVNIPDDYRDRHVSVTKLMRLRVTKEYPLPGVPLAFMREYGVTTVRGPRSMPLQLKEAMDLTHPD